MKLYWLFNHPAPYKIDFFNEIGKNIELTAVFERKKENDRSKLFYSEKPISFKAEYLPTLALGRTNSVSFSFPSSLKNHPSDIVVINGWSSYTEMNAISYLKRHKIPYIFAINGGIAKIKEIPLKRHLKKKYLPGASLYLAPDPASGDYLKFYGVDEKLIRYYPYSTVYEKDLIVEPLTISERKAIRKEEGIPGERLFVSVGSFIKRKNNFELLRIWEKVPSSYTLFLIGEGEEKEAYEKYIASHNLKNVFIKEYAKKDKVLHYFSISDASIFLTKEDIYGHVVNECLSEGTPVIASVNSNAAKNLLSCGDDGSLVRLDSEDEILEAILAPFSEDKAKSALKIARNNTIEKMAAVHLQIFEEYLKR